MELELVSEGPTHRFAGVGNVLVSVYWGAPQAGALRERIPWVEKTAARYTKFGLLVVVIDEAAGGLPDKAFREESRAQAKRWESQLAFSGSVIEGTDVMHTLLRTFLRGLSVVVGGQVQVGFFDSVLDGAAWVSRHAQGTDRDGPSASTLADAVAQLRP
ncbi:MAG: hypothetical protein AB8I08_00075 [Sandaracinaceae bacterium]